ncbi:hypothetical protein D083_3987 [Dickeya solani RNS 08.23.3.1.A]|nr:hypothetical protein D083_3987 [Dickeya solani RNS 08.23.3.1.A]
MHVISPAVLHTNSALCPVPALSGPGRRNNTGGEQQRDRRDTGA